VIIDVFGARHDLDDLPVVAERYGLDGALLLAIARLALSAPDRPVHIEVGEPIS
jgi:hypothetical protein